MTDSTQTQAAKGGLWTPEDDRKTYRFKTATSAKTVEGVTHIEWVPGFVLFKRDDVLVLASNSRFTFDIVEVEAQDGDE